jgi:hypothetical protein
MFLVCVTDQVRRLTGIGERKPVRAEQSATRSKSRAV